MPSTRRSRRRSTTVRSKRNPFPPSRRSSKPLSRKRSWSAKKRLRYRASHTPGTWVGEPDYTLKGSFTTPTRTVFDVIVSQGEKHIAIVLLDERDVTLHWQIPEWEIMDHSAKEIKTLARNYARDKVAWTIPTIPE